MSSRIDCSGLSIARELYDLVETDIIPGTGVRPKSFWDGLASLVQDLGPQNRVLLKKRALIQSQINAWHQENPGAINAPAYKAFSAGNRLPRAGRRRLRNFTPLESIERSQRLPDLSWWCRSATPLCLECRQRALGQPVRCPVWHGRDCRRRRLRKRQKLQPGPRPQGHRTAAALLDQVAPLDQGKHIDVPGYTVDASVQPASLDMSLADGSTTALPSPDSLQDSPGWRHRGHPA